MPDEAPVSEADRRAYNANATRALVYEGFIHFQLWTPIWVIYLRDERGLSFFEITTLDALFFLTQVVMEVPTGAFADRFGRKTSLVAGSIMLAAAVLVFGLAETYLLIFVSYVFWALASTLQSGADSALLYESLKLAGREAEFTKVQGRILAIFPAASLLGGLVGAPLAAATDLSTPILISACFAAMGAVVALTFKEPPRDGPSTAYLATAREGVSYAVREPPVRYAIIFSGLAGVTMAVGVLSQPFLIDHGAPLGSLGLIQMPVQLAGIFGSLVAYRVAQRLGDWHVFTLAPLIAGFAYLGIAGWDSIYAFGLFPLITLTNRMRNPIVVRYVNERIPAAQRATILSVRNLALALCIAFVEPVAGLIADATSFRYVFLFLGAFVLLTIPPLLYLWRRSEGSADAASDS
jgi:MFS family permease